MLPKAASIILAGGEGSRLGHKGPKGTVLYQGASIFSHLLRKLPHPTPPLLILTSHRNHADTQRHFEEHLWFGHDQKQISLISQPDLSYLDLNGHPLPFQGPNGNGGLLDVFDPLPWKKQGIEQVVIIPVDNPKADPFDLELLAFQKEISADIVFRAFLRSDPKEKVGVSDGSVIFDYQNSDISNLSIYPLGNMNLFSCSLDFLAENPSLETHWVRKTAPSGALALKGEKFITDLTKIAHRSRALICEREKWFMPIKTAADLF